MKRVDRKGASLHLEHIGLPIAAATLAKKAVTGSGPPFAIWNGRAIYEVEDLESWARTRLSRKMVNTAQQRSQLAGRE